MCYFCSVRTVGNIMLYISTRFRKNWIKIGKLFIAAELFPVKTNVSNAACI